MRSQTIPWAIRGASSLLATISLTGAGALAQELAPRAYWPAPNRTNVIVVGYQYTTGDIVTDASLPLTGVDSRIHYILLTYQRTFSLLARTATLQFNVPYTRGSTEGFVEGEFRRRDISAMADARVRLTVNLRGAPSMDAKGFQALRATPRTIVGGSILVQAPTGGWESDKAINAGTNRWAVKPAVGVIWPMRPTWLLELELGSWFFGDNDDFLGTTREQDPILSGEIHLVKRIRPGFWASLNVNFYGGGRTTVGGEGRADLQRSSRIGATVLFPLKGRQALRFAYSAGIVTESGGEFQNVSVSYMFAWR
jgi:hypothetical protein